MKKFFIKENQIILDWQEIIFNKKIYKIEHINGNLKGFIVDISILRKIRDCLMYEITYQECTEISTLNIVNLIEQNKNQTKVFTDNITHDFLSEIYELINKRLLFFKNNITLYFNSERIFDDDNLHLFFQKKEELKTPIYVSKVFNMDLPTPRKCYHLRRSKNSLVIMSNNNLIIEICNKNIYININILNSKYKIKNDLLIFDNCLEVISSIFS